MPRRPLATPEAIAAIEQDPRWRVIVQRDASARGQFVYGVRSTGVYCHPGSSARQPRPENVEFFATPAQAEAAGYRPNRRVAQTAHTAHITQACQALEQDPPPSLEQLAEAAGMSPWHFHRVFKRATGLTPKAWAAANRDQRMREQLTEDGSITDALYDAGYSSSSRFYERADRVLGMTPGQYRKGGARTCIHFAIGECSLGAILVARSERGVCAISLGDDPQAMLQALQDRFHNAELIGADGNFEQWMAHVVGLVETPGAPLDLPLDIRGTAFEQRVWSALREIPPGHTASYAEVARAIGAPSASRAVAQACGSNPLAVAIPCHRVVRQDGALSGYRWGVERKRELLRREAAGRLAADN